LTAVTETVFISVMRRVPALLVLALAASSAAACAGSSMTSTNTKSLPQVVAAENFWGNIAAQIGGGHIAVTSIITDPNADPHTYETDPKSASAFSHAQLVILNGAGYDDFASKLLSSNGKSGTTVLRVDQLVGASGDNPNPHLWYSPTYVTEAATAIEKDLAAKVPSAATEFAANLTTFLAAYQPYVATLNEIKAKYDGTKIAYTERVPGYLVQAAGLILGTPATFAQSIEDGNDPSPGDTAAIDDAMEHHTVKVLLYNAQVTSPVTAKVQSLAKNAHIPVVGVAETIPSGYPTFQAWQIAQAKAILTALGG
jgi:zinc/manganese transport system substrate-binding protein